MFIFCKLFFSFKHYDETYLESLKFDVKKIHLTTWLFYSKLVSFIFFMCIKIYLIVGNKVDDTLYSQEFDFINPQQNSLTLFSLFYLSLIIDI
jgi:hypothetical protein